jgi:DNA-binding response OmpR family regulator
VEEAASGEAALQVVESWAPDAVLLDIGLPGIDGIELLKKIRWQWPLVRPIVMTANVTMETAIAALRGGALDYLPKPLDAAELHSALSRVRVRSAEAPAPQAA